MRRNHFGRGRVLGALAVAAFLVGGCSRSQPQSVAKRYTLIGEVLAVNPARQTIRVQHQAVAGLMPAMTMDFPVDYADAHALHAGEAIRADLVIDHPGAEPRVDRIWPNDPAAEAAIAAAANALRQDTHERGEEAYRDIGEDIPDFALYDQDGKVVESGRFRGKQIMMDFIYTACPFANMCPASTAKMMEAQRMARQQGIKNVQFVSITLDPEHDTPGVLKEYAAARHIDTSNFCFLTGPDGAVRDLLTQFGVIADFSGGIVKHTLSIVLVDPKGRIIWRDDDPSWTPQEFVERMHRS